MKRLAEVETQLGQLDVSFKAGKIGEDEYVDRRQSLKQIRDSERGTAADGRDGLASSLLFADLYPMLFQAFHEHLERLLVHAKLFRRGHAFLFHGSFQHHLSHY